MNDVEEYPNQKYGWVKENDGSWSLYAPNGTKVIGTAGNKVQVPTPFGETDAATKAYADSAGGGGGGSLPDGQVGVQVLGPYTIDWDSDPNINSDTFYVPGSATIPEGFWITDTLVEFTEEWGDDDSQPTFSMQATLAVAAVEDIYVAEWINKIDPVNGQRNIVVDALNNDTSLSAMKRQFRLDTALWSAEQAETVTAAKFSMELYSNRNPFTKGQIRVWALGVQS